MSIPDNNISMPELPPMHDRALSPHPSSATPTIKGCMQRPLPAASEVRGALSDTSTGPRLWNRLSDAVRNYQMSPEDIKTIRDLARVVVAVTVLVLVIGCPLYSISFLSTQTALGASSLSALNALFVQLKTVFAFGLLTGAVAGSVAGLADIEYQTELQGIQSRILRSAVDQMQDIAYTEGRVMKARAATEDI